MKTKHYLLALLLAVTVSSCDDAKEQPKAYCGDGIKNAEEMCDGQDFGNATCGSIDAARPNGSLTCTSACTIDSKACTAGENCGNGKIDPGEQCDKDDLSGKTCSDIAANLTGTLRCGSGCKFDASSCSEAPAKCGNDAVEGKEICDNNNMNGATCESVNADKPVGVLKCATDCMSFDASDCKAASNNCGNGNIDAGEQCDGDNFDKKTCASMTPATPIGELQCVSGCTAIDTSSCTPVPKAVCGNGVKEDGEKCDKTDFGEETCSSLLNTPMSGSPTCSADCKSIDTSTCREQGSDAFCGDSSIDPGEECDGNNFGMFTCARLDASRPQGNLKCVNCKIDASDCKASTENTICGDGKIDGNEQCDRNNFGVLDCAILNPARPAGQLTCTPTCTIDASKCREITQNGKCGNNAIDSGEECDGKNFGKATCQSMLPDQNVVGKLLCSPQCKIITTQCTVANTKKCGNGVIEPGEQCDGENFGSATTCASVFPDKPVGTLKCTKKCTFNLTACKKSNASKCGNGAIDPGEQCDKDNLGIATCANLNPKKAKGILKCTDKCKFDVSACTDTDPVVGCGNNKVEAGEECDGTDMNGKTCTTQTPNKPYGQLYCTDKCKFNTSACFDKKPKCGNNIIEAGEECDGNNVGYANCATINPDKPKGKISCTNDCTLDASKCSAVSPSDKCGNNAIDPGEQCDKNNFGMATCASVTPQTPLGDLTCENNCTFNVAGCKAAPPEVSCGNNAIDAGEECDKTNFGIATCASVDPKKPVGELKCTTKCKIDSTSCKAAPEGPKCGNGSIDNGEQCDKNNFGAATCASITPQTPIGTLKCTAGCRIDTSGCKKAPITECGNGSIDSGEECDGENFGPATCATVTPNTPVGNLLCIDCRIDTSQCKANTNPNTCGDGAVGQGEDCDGNNMNGKTCQSVKPTHPVGRLKCSEQCTFDTSSCFATTCGNNMLDEDEKCDKVNGQPQYNAADLSCSAFGKGTGIIGCLFDRCIYDFSSCSGGGPKVEKGGMCKDNLDNDGDGKADCEDPDCLLVRERAHCGHALNGKKRVLFDAAHAQTAGRADWVIAQFPYIANIISFPTKEDDWRGRYSAMGVHLHNTGKYVLESFTKNQFTYGNTSAYQDLSLFDILVLPEPNKLYTPDEINAIWQFMAAGKSVFYIADHFNSDRNNDGYDSQNILAEMAQRISGKICGSIPKHTPESLGGPANNPSSLYSCDIDGTNTVISSSPFCMVPVGKNTPSGGNTYPVTALTENNAIVKKIKERAGDKIIDTFAGGNMQFVDLPPHFNGMSCTNHTIVKRAKNQSGDHVYIGASEIRFANNNVSRFVYVGDSTIFSDLTTSSGATASHAQDVYSAEQYAHKALSEILFEWLAKEF